MRRHTKTHQKRDTGKVKEKVKCNKLHATAWRCQCGCDNAVSWWLPVCVTIATMVVRVNYVMSPRSWWILHPDEIYQSVEVAFSQVYDYGFRPYEYLPPPGSNPINPFMNHTLNTGMYALRSFIYPNIFAVVLQFFKLLGLDSNPFMICRIFNGIVTSALPVSVFYFTLTAFKCRLLGFLACAVTAADLHTSVYGTHTLINSFVAPFLFFGLGLCLETDIASVSLSSLRRHDMSATKSDFSDQNENIVKRTSDASTVAESNQCAKVSSQNTDGSFQLSYRLWGRFYQRISHRTPTSANAKIVEDNATSYGESKNNAETGSRLRSYFGGFVIGVIWYVRVDSLLFSAAVLLFLWLSRDERVRGKTANLTCVVTGSFVAVLTSAFEDVHQYGFGTFSPLQWFKFNVLSGRAKFIFERPNAQSCVEFLFQDTFNIAVFVLSAFVFLFGFYRRILEIRSRECAVMISFAALLITYSTIGHKDARFLFNVYVLYAIIVAVSLHTLVILLGRPCGSRFYMWTFIFAFLCVSVSNSYNRFPTAENAANFGWTYGKSKQSRDLNTCLDRLCHLSNVTGVLVNGSIYDMGGYITLKHNVPMLVKIHFEFNLYEAENDNLFGKGSKVKILNDFQDLFHQSNHLYVSGLLRKDARFNYIISPSVTKDFLKALHFKRIFVCGDFSTFHRETMALTSKEKVSIELPVGDNATVLEYEASWLFTHALYRKAITRIERVLELDRSRVRPFQLIMACYEKLRKWEKAVFYQNECYREHGREKCNTQQDKIVLQEEYRRFDGKY